MIELSTASLFCGGGGEMLGKRLAFEQLGIDVTALKTLAINHWELAVLASRRNFPLARVLQEDLTQVSADSLGITHLDMLWASPSCTHFSVARAGRPCSDQQRSHADEVVDRWLARCDVPVYLMENVGEFTQFGPILKRNTTIAGRKYKAGQPDPRRRGEYFHRLVDRIRALGYSVEWRVLCAADYGDATSRRRLFLQAVKDGVPIAWPEPTHIAAGSPNPRGLPLYRSAADIIDWADVGKSIFLRRKPLTANSLRRIRSGLKKYGLRPYIRYLTHGQHLSGSSEPMPTITGSREVSLIAPFITEYHNGPGGDQRNYDPATRPLPTQDTSNRQALISPFLVELRGTAPSQLDATAHPPSEPLPVLTAGGRHLNLVQPFLVEYYGKSEASDLSEPLPTVTTKDRHAIVTLTLRLESEGRLPHVRTEADIDALDLSTPFTIEFDGRRYLVDILYRLLRPRELARAMGFPDWYQFSTPAGKPLSITTAVKLIGNACPVNTVAALIRSVVLARATRYGLSAGVGSVADARAAQQERLSA